MAMLEVKDVHTYYGNIHALKGVSLTVKEGEIVTLIGTNGAGKSTTLNTICGLLHPREGTIVLEGQEIHGMPAHEIVDLGVSQSPEGRRIFGRLTVMENLEMGAFCRTDPEGIRRDMQRVFNLFPRLEERSKQLGGTLSGGEQQMLAMGRALMANPRLVLLDEPSMGLAPILVEDIFRTIQEINRGNSKGFRTHYGFACRVGPDGTIVSSCGTPQEIEDFLRRKYRSWFSGTLIRIRNRLLPTSSCTLSAGAAEA